MTEKVKNKPWVEKYRPKTVSECILPERTKNTFLSFVKDGEMPNLLLTGTAGTGKTTIARALCNDLNMDYLIINASDERNIDVVRTKIKDYASTRSLAGKQKAIILDEADGLNAQSAQPALRAAIEEFSTVRFILTCNYKNKLIDPIHSRTTTIDFSTTKAEKKTTMLAFIKRVFEILEMENIKFDKQVVVNVVKRYFPDNRRILNELQRYAAGGTIDSGIEQTASANIETLVNFVKEKDFGKMKQWVADNGDMETSLLYRGIYDEAYKMVSPECIPSLTIIIGEGMYNAAFVSDTEINTLMVLSRMMLEMEFK